MKVKSTPLYVVVFGHFKGYCGMSDLRKTPYIADCDTSLLLLLNYSPLCRKPKESNGGHLNLQRRNPTQFGAGFLLNQSFSGFPVSVGRI